MQRVQFAKQSPPSFTDDTSRENSEQSFGILLHSQTRLMGPYQNAALPCTARKKGQRGS